MECLNLEEENIIKDIRNLFILRKDTRKLRQEKETKVIKDRILRDIRNTFEHEKAKENYYKPVKNNIEIMVNDEVHKVIEELFDSLKDKFQNNLELIKGNEFVFDYVLLLCYNCWWIMHRFS